MKTASQHANSLPSGLPQVLIVEDSRRGAASMVRALERFGGVVVWQRVDTAASGHT